MNWSRIRRIWCSSLGSASLLSYRVWVHIISIIDCDRDLCTHQLEYRHFHGTLIEVSRLVLDHLDSDDLVRANVLAFCNLPKRPLSENIEDEVSGRTGGEKEVSIMILQSVRDDLLVTCAVVSRQNVVDVEDIIIILIIRAIIMARLTRFCKDSPRVVSGLVAEGRIADAICLSQLRCQAFQRLQERSERIQISCKDGVLKLYLRSKRLLVHLDPLSFRRADCLKTV
jgi:hypothetical protein